MILLDLHMPMLDGLEVLQKLKYNTCTKSIPVVMLTSSSSDPHIDKAYGFGASGYVVKPGDFDQFREKVTKLCQYWFQDKQIACP